MRRREGLDETVAVAMGEVPEWIEVREGAVRYLAAPWHGQKTGAFLDQRPNRQLLARRTHGRAAEPSTASPITARSRSTSPPGRPR